MPKNSRRKKDTRRDAVRKGERYMRAWRSTRSTTQEPHRAPPVAAGVEAEYTPLGLAPIHRVQRLVESRGWVVLDDFLLDGHGMARSTDILWDYAPAFGGAELPDEEEDVVPLKPTSSFSWDAPSAEAWIDVQTAGNFRGCAQHRCVRHRLPLTEAGVAELPRLLTEVEAPARTLDPAPFIECLVDGACANQHRHREEQAEHRDAWIQDGWT